MPLLTISSALPQRTFLMNHAKDIVSVDFFTCPFYLFRPPLPFLNSDRFYNVMDSAPHDHTISLGSQAVENGRPCQIQSVR